ncbi:MAG: TolC family protein [Terriglobia bacterium]
MIRFLFTVGLVFILTVGRAAAQSTPLSLEDCVRLAESAQSSLTLAQQQIEIARFGQTIARAGFLPQFRLENFMIYNSPLHYSPETFSFVSLNGIREYNSLLNTNLEIDTSGRLRATMAKAKADQEAATVTLGIARRDLRRLVTVAFFQLLLARHLVEAAQNTLDEARRFETRTGLLLKKGEASEGDLAKASAQVAFFEQALSNAELQAQLANHALASFWTRNVNTPLVLQKVLEQPIPPRPDDNKESDSTEPFMRRLEFVLLDAQQRGVLADVRRARAELLPQTNVVFEYGVDSNQMTFSDRGYAAFVNLSIPVFDWFKARSATKQFQIHAKQIDFTREITTRTFSKEYWDALDRVKMLHAQILMTQSQVKYSEDDLRISRLRQEAGEGQALHVVVAQAQLAQARTNYYTTLANYWIAKTELDVASGH